MVLFQNAKRNKEVEVEVEVAEKGEVAQLLHHKYQKEEKVVVVKVEVEWMDRPEFL